MIITILDSNISLAVVVLVFVVVFVIVVVVVVVVITWWLGNEQIVFSVGIVRVVSVVGNALFSQVGAVSFVVAIVVGEMMASAATTSWREVNEQRKCGSLAT